MLSRFIGPSLFYLGDNERYVSDVAVSRLLLRFDLRSGHCLSLSDGLPGGRRPADGRHQAPAALHELNHFLRRLPVPPAS